MDEVARDIGVALNRGHTAIVMARASFRRRLALELNKHRRDQPISNQ